MAGYGMDATGTMYLYLLSFSLALSIPMGINLTRIIGTSRLSARSDDRKFG